MNLTDSLAKYWKQLEGNVHPEDADTFNQYAGRHGYNLDYPPPAFIGDIENASIVILDNNGGFDVKATPQEFAGQGEAEDYRRRLRHSAPLTSRAPPYAYYHGLNFSEWPRSGEAVLVNAVAYRSQSTKEPYVQKIARELPSALFHRHWLMNVAVPAAFEGRNLLIVHRWSLWGIKKNELGSPNIIWSTAPVSPHLTNTEIVAAKRWLARC